MNDQVLDAIEAFLAETQRHTEKAAQALADAQDSIDDLTGLFAKLPRTGKTPEPIEPIGNAYYKALLEVQFVRREDGMYIATCTAVPNFHVESNDIAKLKDTLVPEALGGTAI